MRMKYLYLFLFILLFSKAEARNCDFGKTYVCESPAFRLDFDEERKTCVLLYGIYFCHTRYMERLECQYFVAGDTLILYAKEKKLDAEFVGQVSKSEKKHVEIRIESVMNQKISRYIPPEYCVFINDSLFVRNSNDVRVRDIWYYSDLEKDKIVVEYNCSNVVSFRDEFYSEGDLSVSLYSCHDYFAKLIIDGRTLKTLQVPSMLMDLSSLPFDKLIFKPIGKKRLQKFHRKYPIRRDEE